MEVTLIVGILLQVLDAPFLGFPEAVLSLLKTWSISPCWELLGIAAGSSTGTLNAGEEIPRALGTTGFLKDCWSPDRQLLLDPSLLLNSWRVWDRIHLGFGCKTLALWKKFSVS